MASNFTENFGLNQWERSDKVLMEDFNADNAKIDAALAFHPSAELIASVTIGEETITRMELDISQVDWSRYMMLVLMVDTTRDLGFKVSMGSGSEKSIYMYQSTSIYVAHNLSNASSVAHMASIIPVFYDGSHVPLALNMSISQDGSGQNSLGSGGGRRPLSECKYCAVQQYNSEVFAPGDRAVLWGVK